jgi:thiol-disulfide isomerase/thioredoxin
MVVVYKTHIQKNNNMKNIKIALLALLAIGFVAVGFITKQQPQVGLNIGDKAPELKFKNPEGKEIALSSLKGNIVLIDFWASWCGPCRRENPSVVAAWQKFKDQKFENAKGFKIYNVSLDTNADAWKMAITQDGLAWEYHVSDLKGWQSEAGKIYQIYSIPANYLIDADGKILAKNLRGGNLHLELEKYVKK